MRQELVTDALRYAERYFGHRPAILEPARTITYAEMADRCRRLAGALANLGVEKGDRVAALLTNRREYLELNFAVPGVGAALVLLNLRHATAEMRAILEDCTPKVLIIEAALRPVAQDIGFVNTIVVDVEELDYESSPPLVLGEGVGENDPAGIYYTGGTTGNPKGVMLSHRNLASCAHRIQRLLNFTEDDVYLHATPMYHFSDATWTYPLTWAGGAHTVLPKFEPGPVLEAIDRYNVTFQCFLPTLLLMLVDHEDFPRRDVSSLQTVVHGGTASGLLERCVRAFPNVSFAHFYGMTEASGHMSGIVDQQKLIGDPRFATVGRPVQGLWIDVQRRDGTCCEPHEIGEVVGDGANVMLGYWNRPELTAEVLRGGVLHSGDLGYFDEEGNIYVVDRAKDMIRTGGENVFSAEVERAMTTHPAVKEAAVIGVPDDFWGERVHAVVVLEDGYDETSETGIIEHCRASIAGYKVPRSIEFRTTIPKSGVGKYLKRVLREAYVSQQTDSTIPESPLGLPGRVGG
jgi:long-chain acyl-CoA synthetase